MLNLPMYAVNSFMMIVSPVVWIRQVQILLMCLRCVSTATLLCSVTLSHSLHVAKDPAHFNPCSAEEVPMNRVLLLKVFVWRLVSIPISLVTTYFYTGEISTSLNLTVILTLVLTSCQFLYEKLWRSYLSNRIKSLIEKLGMGAYKSKQ